MIFDEGSLLRRRSGLGRSVSFDSETVVVSLETSENNAGEKKGNCGEGEIENSEDRTKVTKQEIVTLADYKEALKEAESELSTGELFSYAAHKVYI